MITVSTPRVRTQTICVIIFKQVYECSWTVTDLRASGVLGSVCNFVFACGSTTYRSFTHKHTIFSGGGRNHATKKSFQRLYGKHGTHKHVREKFERMCKIWPSKKERRKCLAQEFCRYSGVAFVVVPETDTETAETELNKAILNHVLDKAEQPRRHVTTSLSTDMDDDADSYMAGGLLRRSGNAYAVAENTGDHRRNVESETRNLVRRHMRDIDRAIDDRRARRAREARDDEPDIWGPGTGDHAGGTITARHGRET